LSRPSGIWSTSTLTCMRSSPTVSSKLRDASFLCRRSRKAASRAAAPRGARSPGPKRSDPSAAR
jgi:hypothetical protein